MGRKNKHGLPAYLHRDAKEQYYLKYPVEFPDGTKRWKRELLGRLQLKEAVRLRDIRWADIVAGRINPIERKPVGFKQAVESFLAYSKARKRTWQSDVEKVGVMLAHFGDLPLTQFRPSTVEAFLTKWRQRERKVNRPLRDATLNTYIACIQTIMNQAVANGLVASNPIKGLKKYKVNNERTRTLSGEEYATLLQHCGDHIRPMIEVAYTVGMRKGEILALRWDQVEFLPDGRGAINLKPEDTKTNFSRQVPLDEGLVSLIKRQRRLGGCPYVFTYKGVPVEEIKTAFNRAVLAAGIKDFRFHDLRHCAVTNLRKAGVDQTTIMSITGHRTAHMFRRYNHIDEGDRQKALDKIRSFYRHTPDGNKAAA